MKKLLTLITASAFMFLGTTLETEARPHHGYQAPSSTVYVSGYRYGRPIYTEKYLVGYDHCGRPVYKYRTFQPRVSHAAPSHSQCQPAYPSRYSSSQYRNPRGGYSSGTRVTFSFGR
jgi:hypothetical protein